jgi:hypothetical protein
MERFILQFTLVRRAIWLVVALLAVAAVVFLGGLARITEAFNDLF